MEAGVGGLAPASFELRCRLELRRFRFFFFFITGNFFFKQNIKFVSA